MKIQRFLLALPAAFSLLAQGPGSQPASDGGTPPIVAASVLKDPPPVQHGVIPDKRAYGVLPNYRTAEADGPYRPITTGQKFTIARKDSLDWPSYITAGMFAGISQLTNSNPGFKQGVEGYSKRYAASVTDQIVGNFLTEAIMPTVLHQDPRYFRKGHGSFGGRVLYAASRTVISKNDKGVWGFNASEFAGNGMVAALGNAYYPDAVGFSPTMQRMFSQIGTDAISQVLKEFWPDVKNHFTKNRAPRGGAVAD